MHVVHKTSGQLHDRNQQYDVFAFRRDENGIRGYYWDGVLIKDQNVMMTGHLWLNAGVWLYNEFISFRDQQPTSKSGDTDYHVSTYRLSHIKLLRSVRLSHTCIVALEYSPAATIPADTKRAYRHQGIQTKIP
jgi:hypothetical protein